jgi:hypothetical protein
MFCYDRETIDLLVVDSGVLWGRRSIFLYSCEAIHVYWSHLGGVKTMPARPVGKSPDGIEFDEERRWSPHGCCHPAVAGKNATDFAKIFAKFNERNDANPSVCCHTLRAAAFASN